MAHICAVAGVVGLPWLYATTLHGNIYTNRWILFNVPDEERRFYESLAMDKLGIVAAGLIVFAIAIGLSAAGALALGSRQPRPDS